MIINVLQMVNTISLANWAEEMKGKSVNICEKINLQSIFIAGMY